MSVCMWFSFAKRKIYQPQKRLFSLYVSLYMSIFSFLFVFRFHFHLFAIFFYFSSLLCTICSSFERFEICLILIRLLICIRFLFSLSLSLSIVLNRAQKHPPVVSDLSSDGNLLKNLESLKRSLFHKCYMGNNNWTECGLVKSTTKHIRCDRLQEPIVDLSRGMYCENLFL